jgi:uroporphyrinogen decarboxylase
MRDIFLKAIKHEAIPYTPVWMMRQAGRYLPEYQAVRRQAGSFLKLCKTPELACEVTLQPLRRFDFDAAILFSDILTIPDAMDLGLDFIEGEGPRFRKIISSATDIQALPIPDPAVDLSYVTDTIRLLKKEVTVPLIGFAGSPWTLASYMLEGGSPGDFKRAKTLLYTDPKLMHQLLFKLAQAVSLYLLAQIKAGVDVVMLFDSWGGVLTQSAYAEFSLAYMEEIIALVKAHYPEIPVILFTKGGGGWLPLLAKSQASVIGLDWQTSIHTARECLGQRYALQGNLDPAILRGSEAMIRTEVMRILEDFGPGSGHIFNLGHGITPDIDPERVAFFVECIKVESKAYHQV